MAFGRTVGRGGIDGEYNRLALPEWGDPLDSSFSTVHGGRWNAPGTFAVLYLNRGERTARLQVLHKLRGQPFGPEDLDPREQHQLVTVDVPGNDYLDAVSHDGLGAIGLPASYPQDENGRELGWARCQSIGQTAWNDASPGIACRSAAVGASPADEELAFFDRPSQRRPDVRDRLDFDDWFLRAGSPV